MDQNSESQSDSISQDTQDKTEQINEKLNLGSEETKDLASKLMLNDFNWLENKDKTTDNDLSADKILNDIQSNNKLLINFIDKAYGSKSNCEIVDHFQLKFKSIIGYWNSAKHANDGKEKNQTDLSKVNKIPRWVSKKIKINKKSVEVEPTNCRWRTEFDIKNKRF